ncbi:DUF962 domain-containing protein [Agitococcus lubricus]|uniref:Putative membrane protein YGL010W n=1 Tax=Agitococcus lubricus TaxID=1077255 RepID=A0A2T5J0Z9_9GAMM|nr:Mpo1-like protein [Agitococcus lubricus]PTQ90065.1 putative membrane protein YGL010W [Agitococcus lubricus]
MRTLQQWFAEYNDSHRNPINKKIHWLCVPVISFTVLALAYSLHWGVALAASLAALWFYAQLSMAIAIGMFVMLALMMAIASILPNLLWWAIGLFVVAWIGQFVGHYIEGKKPSFFKDLQFLLIGPAWCLDALYAKLGLESANIPLEH